jgi:hypothetical protein
MNLRAGWRCVVVVCLAVTLGWAETASAQAVTLAWDPSPDPSVVGYIVYAGTQSGAYTAEFNVGTATSFVYAVVPDQQYFFVVASYAEGMIVGPVSGEVVGSVSEASLLSNPGDQWGTEGSPTELQLIATDSFDRALIFSEAGLPPGLEVDSKTGLVSGTPTTAGDYIVTVSVSDGVSTTIQTFTWTIVPTPDPVDVSPPVVTITLPAISDRTVTTSPFVAVGGIATDDHGIVAVTWTNSRGGGGAATGTDAWLAGIVLSGGRNDITITAVDEAGNYGASVISIHRQTSSP